MNKVRRLQTVNINYKFINEHFKFKVNRNGTLIFYLNYISSYLWIDMRRYLIKYNLLHGISRKLLVSTI